MEEGSTKCLRCSRGLWGIKVIFCLHNKWVCPNAINAIQLCFKNVFQSPDESSTRNYVNVQLLHGHQSGLPPWPPDGAVPQKTYEGGYESYCDSESGRIYYYNRLTHERSWILPRKVSQSARESAAAEVRFSKMLCVKMYFLW